MIGRVAIGSRVDHVGTVPSTMDIAERLGLDGAPSGTVVIAEHQTRGRGRLGREWVAPPGSALLVSVLLRTSLSPIRLASFSLVLGMAIAPVLDAWLPGPCRLKWPNDLLAGDRKLGGILVQTHPDPSAGDAGQDATTVIVGIGINVATGRAELPPGATSLRTEGGRDVSVGDVAARLWPVLDVAWTAFEDAGGQVDLGPWDARGALIDELVELRLPGEVRRGTMRGVAATGALRLEEVDGTIRHYLSGEVTRGPQPIPLGRRAAGPEKTAT